jgi:bifunctional lysine-specific demethylase and histidyl-hydroxylase NO66
MFGDLAGNTNDSNSDLQLKMDEIPPCLAPIFETCTDGDALGKEVFSWMIAPITMETFFAEYYEKKPLVVKRHNDMPNYYEGLFSRADIKAALATYPMVYGQHLDVTSYKNGVRKTLSVGEEVTSKLWKKIEKEKDGCSIRLYHPQEYSLSFWALNSALQSYLKQAVGTNLYLTPHNAQGFAPHYDDVDVMLLQLEGSKYWQLYSAWEDDMVLPRFSSGDFDQSTLPSPSLTFTLESGDFLYMPRGTVHQGKVVGSSTHSLHATQSFNQRRSLGDFILDGFQACLQEAVEQLADPFRHSLPLQTSQALGLLHSEEEEAEEEEEGDGNNNNTNTNSGSVVNPGRREMTNKIGSAFQRLAEYFPKDAVWDSWAATQQLLYLPPLLSGEEVLESIPTQLEVNHVDPLYDAQAEIRLVRSSCLHFSLAAAEMETEDPDCLLWTSLRNKRVAQSDLTVEEAAIHLPNAAFLVLERLVKSYPRYCPKSTLLMDGDESMACLEILRRLELLCVRVRTASSSTHRKQR